MSAWIIYSMMGIYPITPAEPVYTFVTPTFDKIKLHLNKDFYENGELIIENNTASGEIEVQIDGSSIKRLLLNLTKDNFPKKIKFL